MNIQLDFQGKQIDVPLQDPNAVCQYLYDFAQNGFSSQVSLFFTLPDGIRGEVDPEWSIIELVQAEAKFFVNPIEQSDNILINIFLEDQQCTQFNANSQQTLKQVLDYVNENMQKQYQESELYDQQGNGLTNILTDIFGQFTSELQPFLLFIPKCQSGIQNFVQQTKSQIKTPQQIQIEVYYQYQKCAELTSGSQETMQEILNFVNENTGQQDTTFELYDAQGNKLSNNLYDKFSYYAQDKQPLQFYVPKRGLQSDNQNQKFDQIQQQEILVQIIVDNTQYRQILVKPKQKLFDIINETSTQIGKQLTSYELFSQTGNKLSQNGLVEFGNYSKEEQPLFLILKYTQQIQLQVYLNGEQITDMEVSSNSSIQEVLDKIGQQNNQQYREYVIIDNNNNILNTNNPSDLFNSLDLSNYPIHMYIIFNNQIQKQSSQQQKIQLVQQHNLIQMPNILIYSYGQKISEIQANQQLFLQEVLDYVNKVIGKSEMEFQLQDSQGLVLTNNPTFTISQFVNFCQPLRFCVLNSKTGSANIEQYVPQSQNKRINLIVFLNNEFQMQLQPDKGQTIQEVIDMINQNLSDKVFRYELYHKTKKHILSTNSPNDRFEKFFLFTEPLIFMCYTTIFNNSPISQQQSRLLTFGDKGNDSIEQQESLNSLETQYIQGLKGSFNIEEKFSLFIDPSGELVLFKFHHPVLFSGTLKKSNSKLKAIFKRQNYQWKSVHKIRYTKLSDYGFIIEWNSHSFSIVQVWQH